MSMKIQGAIFDCDGILADTETPDYESWRTLYEEHGLDLPLSEWARFIGTAKGAFTADWHAPLEKLGKAEYDREAMTARRRGLYREAIDSLVPMPGVIALLDAFAAEGIPCAVASNSEAVWVREVLARTGLESRFVAIANAEEVPNPKPAPDVYLLAASRLNADPSQCVAFEDSPRGLEAAVAAGMISVAVPTSLTRALTFAGAHHLVETLEAIDLATLCRTFE